MPSLHLNTRTFSQLTPAELGQVSTIVRGIDQTAEVTEGATGSRTVIISAETREALTVLELALRGAGFHFSTSATAE
jgi:hypothetical protein